MISCLQYVRSALLELKQANVADDKEDKDHDGIADVKQIDRQQLVQRKAGLFFRTVDPQGFQDAIGGLWTGYMGVLAVLKFQFAKTTALALSLGDNARPLAAKLFAPTMLSLTPVEYHHWV